MILSFHLSPQEKKINVEKETKKKIKEIGKDIIIKPENFYFGHIFVDASYLCYSLDFSNLSEETQRRRKTE